MPTIEIVFYVHGVSPDPIGRPHTRDYERLHRGIAQAAGHASLWPTEHAGAEWGWNFDKGIAQGHKALADAQRRFGAQVLSLVEEESDPTMNPLRAALNRLRPLIFNGFGDMFYYVSHEGKWEVRHEVGRQLLAHINERRPSQANVSLTLVGHSAGSVIAFDFLYYMFSQKSPATHWRGSQLSQLRTMVANRELRLRRLITFGSPISFLMFRSNWLVETLAQKGRLSPEDHGMTSELPGSQLDGHRWINIWDKDDPIAWPVAPVMDSELVEDVYVDVSDSVARAHDAYWRSKRCHQAIAARW